MMMFATFVEPDYSPVNLCENGYLSDEECFTYVNGLAYEGGIVPAFEIMTLNPAIRTNIREKKIQSIDSVIDTSSQEGMISMNTSLLNLIKEGKISEKTAFSYTTNAENLTNKIYYASKGGAAPAASEPVKEKKGILW